MTGTAILCAVLSGAVFGLTVHIQRQGLDRVPALEGAFVSVLAMAVVYWALAPFFVDPDWVFSRATAVFIVGGLFLPALGQRFQIAAISHVGPALTSALGSFTPLFAIVPAVLFLGEAPGPRVLAGAGVMIAGLVLAARPGRAGQVHFALWALSIPLAAAAARGLVQPITKTGIALGPSAFYAGLVYATVSSFVLAAMMRASGAPVRPRFWGAGRGWFAVSGVLNGLGILLLGAALGLGQVSVAAPLSAAAPLWSLIYGAVIFRREELTRYHLWVAVLVVAGAGLVASG